MITVSYGLHYRRKRERLVAKMMDELIQFPFEYLNFLDLRNKNWEYLGKNTNGFVFDVHGGVEKEETQDSYSQPKPTFVILSPTAEKEFIRFFKNYRMAEILLIHKDEGLRFEGSKWCVYEITYPCIHCKISFMETLKKYGLLDRFIGIELMNASEEWQIREYHMPFMKKFLSDLNRLESTRVRVIRE